MNNIGHFIIGLFIGQAEKASKEVFIKAFEKIYAKNPARHKLLLVSLYPVIDVELEDVVKATKTTFDDAGVRALKQAMEDQAVKYGFELPNLDAGTIND